MSAILHSEILGQMQNLKDLAVEVKARVDVVAVARRYCQKVRKSGSGWKARLPKCVGGIQPKE